MAERDRPRRLAPARPEPGRRVEAWRIEGFEHSRAVGGNPAQDRVDQPGEGAEAGAPGERDRGRDGGVRRGRKEQEGGGAKAEHMPHRDRRGAAEMRLEHRIERPEPPQHRRRQPMRRRPIAPGGAGKPPGETIERRVQGAAAVESLGQQQKGAVAGRIRREGCGHDPFMARFCAPGQEPRGAVFPRSPRGDRRYYENR